MMYERALSKTSATFLGKPANNQSQPKNYKVQKDVIREKEIMSLRNQSDTNNHLKSEKKSYFE